MKKAEKAQPFPQNICVIASSWNPSRLPGHLPRPAARTACPAWKGVWSPADPGDRRQIAGPAVQQKRAVFTVVVIRVGAMTVHKIPPALHPLIRQIIEMIKPFHGDTDLPVASLGNGFHPVAPLMHLVQRGKQSLIICRLRIIHRVLRQERGCFSVLCHMITSCVMVHLVLYTLLVFRKKSRKSHAPVRDPITKPVQAPSSGASEMQFL